MNQAALGVLRANIATNGLAGDVTSHREDQATYFDQVMMTIFHALDQTEE